jgi:hypothetical protein
MKTVNAAKCIASDFENPNDSLVNRPNRYLSVQKKRSA